MKYLVLVLMLVGCQTLKQSLHTLQGSTNHTDEKILVGKQKHEVLDKLGDPIYINRVKEGIEVLEFEKYFFVIYNNVVTNVIEKSNLAYEVEISSFGNFEERNPSIGIISGIEGVPTEDLEFKEYVKPIIGVFKSLGYKVVSAKDKPKYLLIVKYGISDPIVETRVWSTPVYNFIPGNTTTTNIYGSRGYVGSAVTSTPGQVNYAGQNVHSSTEKTYRRYIALELIDNNVFMKTKKISQVWKANVSSTGVTQDLQAAVAGMISAGRKYVGKNSFGQRVEVINLTDPRIVLYQTY